MELTTQDYNEIILRFQEIKEALALCHPVLDTDIKLNLRIELEELAERINKGMGK